ncbi:MAG: thioredoxin domain-containing protein [Chloroflexota bacterium]
MGCLGWVGSFFSAIVLLFLGVSSTSAPPISTGTDIDFERYEGMVADRTEDGGFILGDPGAPITIVAFEDFLCSHCQDFQPTVQEIITEYVATGQARFEFRMLPISTQSMFVFQLVECVAVVEDDPLMFWYAHDVMFDMTTANTFDALDFADTLDISYPDLLACTEEADQYTIDQQLGVDDGVTGTPTIRWRLDGGDLRSDIIPPQPTADQIGDLIALYGDD